MEKESLTKRMINRIKKANNRRKVNKHIASKLGDKDSTNKVLMQADTQIDRVRVENGVIRGTDLVGNRLKVTLSKSVLGIEKDIESSVEGRYFVVGPQGEFIPNKMTYSNVDMYIGIEFMNREGITVDSRETCTNVTTSGLTVSVAEDFIKEASKYSDFVKEENAVENIIGVVSADVVVKDSVFINRIEEDQEEGEHGDTIVFENKEKGIGEL